LTWVYVIRRDDGWRGVSRFDRVVLAELGVIEPLDDAALERQREAAREAGCNIEILAEPNLVPGLSIQEHVDYLVAEGEFKLANGRRPPTDAEALRISSDLWKKRRTGKDG
jgi:hypothetical protein